MFAKLQSIFIFKQLTTDLQLIELGHIIFSHAHQQWRLQDILLGGANFIYIQIFQGAKMSLFSYIICL